MMKLPLAGRGERLSILCLGAHSDDIEIGAGGTILQLLEQGELLDVCWCVLSAEGERASEARRSAAVFLENAASRTVEIGSFEDSFFPAQSREIKTWLLAIRNRVAPDLIFTHSRDDAHQDHREISKLTTNVFRDALVLEYEIPKWDGDFGSRNTYFSLDTAIMEQKIRILQEYFGSQRSKDWFDAETFRGLARLRGMECRAPQRYAEAFTVRKFLLG